MPPILLLLTVTGWQLMRAEAMSMGWESSEIESNGIDESSNTNSVEDHSSDAEGRINLSMPGTKWCGPGSTAANYDDLGTECEVDMCCRDHDHCDNIPAGQTKYNLTNADFFTRLNCGCDRRFRQCLRDINSTTSNRVGRIYFTLRNKCYFDDHPIVKCEAYDTDVFVKRCIQYQLDMEQPRRYQWFDTPLYRDKKERDAMNDEENYI